MFEQDANQLCCGEGTNYDSERRKSDGERPRRQKGAHHDSERRKSDDERRTSDEERRKSDEDMRRRSEADRRNSTGKITDDDKRKLLAETVQPKSVRHPPKFGQRLSYQFSRKSAGKVVLQIMFFARRGLKGSRKT